MKASTESRTGPVAARTTYHERCGSPPRGRIDSSSPRLELELDGRARLKRDAEPDARRLLDRSVGAEREDARLDAVRGEVLLAQDARARPRLAQQPRARGQLVHADPAALGQLVAGRGDEHPLVVHEGAPRQPAVLGHSAGDGDVDVVVGQALEDVGAVADVEADLELGMQLAEALDERRDEELARRRHRADAQRAVPAVGGLARRAAALVEQPEHVGGIRRVGGAGRRRAQRAPRALGQRDAELALERGHRGRHRGLRDHELLGCGGDGSAPDDGQEGDKLGESDRHGCRRNHIGILMRIGARRVRRRTWRRGPLRRAARCPR